MGEHLVADEAGIVQDEDVLDGNCRSLSQHDPPQRVGHLCTEVCGISSK